MPLQSRALKAVGRAAKSGEDHPLETCGLHRRGGWGRGGGWAGGAAVAVGDRNSGAEAGAADGAEEGEDCALEGGGPSGREEAERGREVGVQSHNGDEVVVADLVAGRAPAAREEGRARGGERRGGAVADL